MNTRLDCAWRKCGLPTLFLLGVVFAVQSYGSVTDAAQRNPVSSQELAGAAEAVQALPIADWLGPLAPMALSPFFGITCLSGLALFGGEWMPIQSGLLHPDGPLASHAVFWTFLTLTVLTSLPRLTKVSKPFAQAVDHVEAWAGIATMLILRVVMSVDGPAEEVAYYQAGMLSVTADVLLMIAMTINVVVIHAVRFFFEFMIWATPVPFIDACFEVLNKAVCAGLMALYAYSPTGAAAINLVMFAACLFVFRWIHRRVVFCRTMALDPILSALMPTRAQPSDGKLVVFPTGSFGPFAARSRLVLEPQDDGWRLSQRRWFGPPLTMDLSFDACDPIMHSGVVANTLVFNAEGTKPVSFSKRYADLTAVAVQLRCTAKETEAAAGKARPEPA